MIVLLAQIESNFELCCTLFKGLDGWSDYQMEGGTVGQLGFSVWGLHVEPMWHVLFPPTLQSALPLSALR